MTVAAGQIPNFTANPFVAVETMTAYMVQVGLGDAPHGTLEHKTLYAVALLLFRDDAGDEPAEPVRGAPVP